MSQQNPVFIPGPTNMPEEVRKAPRATRPPSKTNGARDARRALRRGRKAAVERAKAQAADKARVEALIPVVMADVLARRERVLDGSAGDQSALYPQLSTLQDLVGDGGVMTHSSSTFDENQFYTFRGANYYTWEDTEMRYPNRVEHAAAGFAPLRTASGVDLAEIRDAILESVRLYRRRYW